MWTSILLIVFWILDGLEKLDDFGSYLGGDRCYPGCSVTELPELWGKLF